jgi:hypothetical protein
MMGHARAWTLWIKTTGEWVLSNSDSAGNGRSIELTEDEAAPLIAALAAAIRSRGTPNG